MSLKILTIDDSEVIRLIVSKAFKNFDCMVLEAENGLTGLSVASREKPDLVLLDYMMPVMDGFEVLAKLRSEPELKGIPVIMLTAEAARESVIKVAQLGVRDYLIKPFKGELLVERVSRVLDLKQRTASAKKRKRYDDPIGILVVDDKPAISAQVQAGLADTPWKVIRAEKPVEAIDHCRGEGVDLVLASLMLPNDGAFSLLQSLRSYSETAALPVFGMCVRTAAAEQTRAQQVGFAGVVTKPIDCMELKTKVCRTLSLETSYKYFQQNEGYLILTLPKDFNPAISQVISANLETQLECTADGGGDRLIVDMSEVEAATVQVVELVLSAIELATKLPLRCAVVGTEAVQTQCLGFGNTQSWKFATSVEQALELLR